MQRDREVNAALTALNYKIFRFWEQQLKKDFDACFLSVLDYLEQQKEQTKTNGRTT